MAKHVQLIRHSTAAADAYVGYPGEVTVDTDLNNLRLHDGTTPGGQTFQNEAQYAANNFRGFSALAIHSVPGVLPNSVVSKYNQFTNAGTYELPLLTAASVGSPIVLEATVAGIDIDIPSPDLVDDGGADVANLSLTQFEIVRLEKLTTARWKVVNRF